MGPPREEALDASLRWQTREAPTGGSIGRVGQNLENQGIPWKSGDSSSGARGTRGRFLPGRTLLAGLAAVVLVLAASAAASAPPVGPLPAGPTAKITTARGELFAVALPAQPSGRVWRLKGSIDRTKDQAKKQK